MPKKSKRKMNPVLEYLIPRIALFGVHTLPFLPLLIVRLIAKCWFLLLYPIAIVTGLIKRYERNIDKAFQEEIRPGESRRIARRTLYNWLMNVFEILHFYHRRRYKDIVNWVDIEGLEKINQAKKDGMGVVGVTAHFGNFALMVLRLAQEDVDLSFLFKELKPALLGSLMTEYMQKIDLNPIVTNIIDKPSQQALRDVENSGFVVFVADEFKRNTGVEIDFFGMPTRQALGPAVVSLKTGAPMIPLFVVRERGRFRVIIEDPIEFEPTGDTDKDLVTITQKRMAVIERYIRRYPDEWLWVHSRWIDKKAP